MSDFSSTVDLMEGVTTGVDTLNTALENEDASEARAAIAKLRTKLDEMDKELAEMPEGEEG